MPYHERIGEKGFLRDKKPDEAQSNFITTNNDLRKK